MLSRAFVLSFSSLALALAFAQDGQDGLDGQYGLDGQEVLAAPPPGTFSQVTARGNGCPGGQLRIVPDDVSNTLSVYPSDKFMASQNLGGSAMDFNKNCILQASVSYPPNMQFSIVPSDWTGYAKLDKDVIGNFISDIFFSSAADNTSSFRQPISGDQFLNGSLFTIPSAAITPSNLWSQCGGNDIVSVNFRLTLTGDRNEFGQIQEYSDPASSDPHHTVKLIWRPC